MEWTGETVAWIVFGVSTFYLLDRFVIWLVRRIVDRYRRKRAGPL
jgi:hypothetical protein